MTPPTNESSRKRRQLKKLDFYWSLHGFQFGFPFCCVDFFESVWCTSLRADNDINSNWYNQDFSGYDTSRLSGGDNRILCPECVVQALVN